MIVYIKELLIVSNIAGSTGCFQHYNNIDYWQHRSRQVYDVISVVGKYKSKSINEDNSKVKVTDRLLSWTEVHRKHKCDSEILL